jgi:DNA (cytosine-5)-methyltransferase 1
LINVLLILSNSLKRGDIKLVPIKILDLFAGAGGLSYGFELVKDEKGKDVFELHRAVEKNHFACETLRNRYGEDKIIEGDLTDRKVQNKVINDCKNRISVIVAGIPCQSFSQIGPRSGYGKNNHKFKKDPRDNLYKIFCKITASLKPKIFVMENVRGLLSKSDDNGNKIIDKIIKDMEKLNYNLKNEEDGKKYVLLNAADYGVPQKRQRVILIGFLKDWSNKNIPKIKPTHYDPKKESNNAHDLLPYVNLYDAIGDLPPLIPKITDYGLSNSKKKEISRHNKNRNNGEEKITFDIKRFNEHIKFCSESGKEFLNYIRSDQYEHIDHHVARPQQWSDLELFELMEEGETAKFFIKREPVLAKELIKYDMSSFNDKYRRQKSNEPCTTIFAHLAKDGNRFIHPTQVRTLTPREAARIQSFPDDYIFQGPFIHKFKQIGNAVPPLLSKRIGETIYVILSKKEIATLHP